MPSLGALVDDIIGTLHGHVDAPATGTLTAGIDDGELVLAVDFGDLPGSPRPHGVIEIGSELMSVSRWDAVAGQLTIPPWGRGHLGTVAVGHPIGSRVTVRPRFPRKRVIEAVNEAIRASSPPLYAARDLDPISIGGLVEIGYPLPEDTLRVLRVDATDAFGGPLANRRLLSSWRVRTVAGAQLLEIPRNEVLQTLQITIAANPSPLVDEDDDFATVTGLPESAVDIVIYGALAKLVMGVELARQQVISPDAMARADKVPVQSGIAISRYYTALLQQRLSVEQDRLNMQHPIQLLRRG